MSLASLLLASWVISPLAFAAEVAAGVAPNLAAALSAYTSGDSIQAQRQFDDLLAQSTTNTALKSVCETTLIQVLQTPSSTAEAKLFACQRLAIVGTEACLPALGTSLDSQDTVGMACLALANIPSQKAGQILRDALPRLRGNAKIQVIQTLGARRQPASSALLSALTRDADLPAAEAAIAALGKIADPTAADTLAALRAKTDSPLAHAVQEASLVLADQLVARKDAAAAKPIYEQLLAPANPAHVRAGALRALCRLDQDHGEARLLEILREPAPEPDSPAAALRPVAIAAVGGIESKVAAADFAELLPRLPVHEQVLLLDALADLGEDCPLDALVRSLDSTEASVRLAAIHALAKRNLADVRLGQLDVKFANLPDLITALAKAQTPAERQVAEDVFVQLPGGQYAVYLMLVELMKAKASAPAKPGIFAALGRRGATEAIPTLYSHLKSTEPGVAKAAWLALGRLVGPTPPPQVLTVPVATTDGNAPKLAFEAGRVVGFPDLLDSFLATKPGDVRDTAQTTLVQILARMPADPSRSDAVCAKLSTTTDPTDRAALLSLLPVAGGPTALAAVKSALNDSDATVREAALRALTDWATADAWDDLLALYQKQPAGTQTALALRGLTRLANDENAKPSDALAQRYRVLIETARTDDDRKQVLGALGGCAHPDALKLALPLLENAAVRAEAASAVRRIAEALKGTHPQLAAEALAKLEPKR